jgi:hypothetical protein
MLRRSVQHDCERSWNYKRFSRSPLEAAPVSVQRRLLEEIIAVCRPHAHAYERAFAPESEWNLDARGTQAPHLAKQVGECRCALSCDFEYQVAGPNSRAIGRPAIRQSADY